MVTSNSDNDPQNHHFNPAVLLRRFTNNPRDHREMLCCYDKMKQKLIRINPTVACREKNLNTVEKVAGVSNVDFETQCTVFDTEFANFWSEKPEKDNFERHIYTLRDRLIGFIHSLFFRSPTMRLATANIITKHTSVDVMSKRNKYDFLHFYNAQIAKDWTNKLKGCHWCPQTSQLENDWYITADVPFCSLPFKDAEILTPLPPIYVPIDKEWCLLISHKEILDRSETSPVAILPNDVLKTNRAMFTSAHRFVYGTNESIVQRIVDSIRTNPMRHVKHRCH